MASASEPAQEGFWFLWDVLSVWPWRAFLSSWSVLSCLSGLGGPSCRRGLSCPVLSVWPWRAVLSCFVLSCLFSPGRLLIPPHFPREIFRGGSKGSGCRGRAEGAEAKGPEDHLPWSPELPAPPWSPELPAPPWSPELPAPPWSPELPAPPWSPELPAPPWSLSVCSALEVPVLRSCMCLSRGASRAPTPPP